MALRFLMAHPWAISGNQLEVMAGLSARDLDGINLKELAGLTTSLTPMAVATKAGIRNAAGIEMRDGIAIIPVSGVISRYAGMFEAICGGTSTQTLALSIQAALDDPACRGILLAVDTPGGEANGIHELAEMIYAARGKKPIKAYVSGTGASAGYWIAAAADEIIMDATAMVGSIGTVQSFRFRKEKDESVETLELVSSQSPDKRLDPRSDAGKAKYQASLDQLSDVFIDCVAKYRGVKRAKVLSDFGQGWCLIGADAVKAGMADKLGSYESTINEMKKGRSSMTITAKTEETTIAAKATIAQAISMSAGMSVVDVVASLSEHAPEVVAALSTPAPLAVVGVAGFIGAQSAEVQAAIKAHFAEAAPASALSKAAETVQALTAAGVPEMAAGFLTEGKTFAQVEATAKMASSLKDTLAAAGLSGSLASIMAVSDNPGQMVALAIQEAQAKEAGADAVEAETPAKPKASLDYDSIYEDRK
ncbi:MAG: S49 family peptidase [Aeromonas sobria]|uniref:S49 family peptidase n=1 Tax=Aeromonas sobria TaxID=646 RepID=UPI003F36CD8C